jgi:hypothetical protein
VSLGNEKIAVFSEAEVKIAIHGLLKVFLSLFQIIKVPENQLLNLPLFFEKQFKHNQPLQTVKYQIPSTKSQGVRCRVSGVREEKQKN